MPDAGGWEFDALGNLASVLDDLIPKASEHERSRLEACRDRLQEATAYAAPVAAYRNGWRALQTPALVSLLEGLGAPPALLAPLMGATWRARIALLASSPFENIARDMERKIRHQDRTLIPCFAPAHSILMEFVKEPFDAPRSGARQKYTIRVYNAGFGLRAHTERASNSKSRKFETVLEHTGVELEESEDSGDGHSRLSGRELLRLFTEPIKFPTFTTGWEDLKRWWTGQMNHPPEYILDRITFVYAWLAEKGTRGSRDDVVPQAGQKGGDCTIETSLAFLRQNLPDATYKWVKAEILTRAIDFVEATPARELRRPPEPAPTLKTRYQLFRLWTKGGYEAERLRKLHAKRDSALAGMNRAQRYSREEARLRTEPWFLGRKPSRVGEALAQLAAKTGGQHFGIVRSLDAKGDFALVRTAAEGKVERLPIRFDRDGSDVVLVHPDKKEERFASLDAVAQEMRQLGFAAAEPLRGGEFEHR